MVELKDILFKATLSRGPGGQNVNKVHSAAFMLWNFEESSLQPEIKETIRTKLAQHINKSGLLFIRSDELRDLEKNKKRCLEKLKVLLRAALHKPKARKKTRPSFASVNKRIASKKNRSEIKKGRKKLI